MLTCSIFYLIFFLNVLRKFEINFKSVQLVLIGISTLCLLGIGLIKPSVKINVQYYVHTIIAYDFFLFSPLAIRKLVQYNENSFYKIFSEWLCIFIYTSGVFFIVMFKGQAIAEISSIVLLSVWVLYTLYKFFIKNLN